MFMFQNQINYSSATKQKLAKARKFFALIYVPAWFNATFAADAPINDPQFGIHLNK